MSTGFVAPEGFMTPEEAAATWSTRKRPVSRRTVVSWCTRGLIVGVRKVPLSYDPPRSRAHAIGNPAFGYAIPKGAKMPHVTRGRPPKRDVDVPPA